MRARFDLYDWTVRRAMLLTGILLTLVIGLVLCCPLWVMFVAAVVILLLALLPPMRRIVPYFCLIIVLIGLWRGAAFRFMIVEPTKQAVGRVDTIEGTVVDCPRDGHMYTVRLSRSSALPQGSDILLYCSDLVAPSLSDKVYATVEYKPLYTTQTYQRADGVFIQAYPTTFDEGAVVSHSSDEIRFASLLRPMRDRMAASITELLGGDVSGLLSAVCLGDRSVVSDRISASFRASGLSHLLSVSGLHMSVIAGATLFLMRILRIKKWIGNLLAAIIILLFMWIVEFTPSVTRAGIMYLVLLIGQMTRHQGDSLNSLGLALTLIILISPSSIFDVGLWLSFSATLGILCVTPRVQRFFDKLLEKLPSLVKIPLRWICTSVSISIGCTLPVMPILLFVFGEISLISSLTNLFAVLPSVWMCALGCVGALMSVVPFMGWIGKGCLLLAGVLAKWIIGVSAFFADVPGALFRPTTDWLVVLVGLAGVLISLSLCVHSLRGTCCIICAILSAITMALPLSGYLSENSIAISVSTGTHGAVVVVKQNDKAVLLCKAVDDLYAAARVMEDMRVYEPELLVADTCRTQDEAVLAQWRQETPTLAVACGEELGESALSDFSLQEITALSFWEMCELRVLSDDWWWLSIGDTSILIALSKQAVLSDAMPRADAVVIFGSALHGDCALTTDVVLCIGDKDTAQRVISDSESVCFISEDESCRLVTIGDGTWRRSR